MPFLLLLLLGCVEEAGETAGAAEVMWSGERKEVLGRAGVAGRGVWTGREAGPGVRAVLRSSRQGGAVQTEPWKTLRTCLRPALLTEARAHGDSPPMEAMRTSQAAAPCGEKSQWRRAGMGRYAKATTV